MVNLLGNKKYNPILNMVVYNVDTPDGNIAEYISNIIAEKYTAR